jgi:hypothetical protein
MLWTTYFLLCCGPTYVTFSRGSRCQRDTGAELTQHKLVLRLANLNLLRVRDASSVFF